MIDTYADNNVQRLIRLIRDEARQAGFEVGKLDVVFNLDGKNDAVPSLHFAPAEFYPAQKNMPALGILKILAPGQDNLLPLLSEPREDALPSVFTLSKNEIRRLKTWDAEQLISLEYLESLQILHRQGREWTYSQVVVDGGLVGAQEIYLDEKQNGEYQPFAQIGGYDLGKRYRICWMHVLPGSNYRVPLLRAAWLPLKYLEDPFRQEGIG